MKRNNLYEIKIEDMSDVFCKQYDFVDGYCVGTIEGHNGLHLINQRSKIAKRLPDDYQRTPIYISPDCGGFSEGLIMVSLMDEIELAYFHDKSGCAGL